MGVRSLLLCFVVLGACNSFDIVVNTPDAGTNPDGSLSSDTNGPGDDSGSSTGMCADGVKNGDESDVDCGGSCVACVLGKYCGLASDCESGMCPGGVCVCNYGPFSVPINIGGGVNTTGGEWDPALSSDGLILYFAGERSGTLGDGDLWMATRQTSSGSFSSVTNLTALNTANATEGSPTLWGSGLEILYDTWQTWGLEGTIVHAARQNLQSDFAPVNDAIFSNINDANSVQLAPWLSEDGLLLVYTSDEGGDFELWQSTRSSTSEAFQTPTSLDSLNGIAGGFAPALSKDGLTIYFGSSRAGGVGDDDIWSASRSSVNGTFSTPSLVPNVNSASTDGVPYISDDGLTLLFTSFRAGGQGGADIWQATRQCE
ncbi:MAG: PD40 domain-containing protein [Myxococcales bacterium]|nr:MAG: PD40 domain-containing protein [Myxococcales bacterium]